MHGSDSISSAEREIKFFFEDVVSGLVLSYYSFFGSVLFV